MTGSLNAEDAEESRGRREQEKARLDRLTDTIIGAAIEVHRELGPGLLESAYEACLAHELRSRGVGIVLQRALPVVYRGVAVECAYRLDLVVDERVIVEVKALEHLLPVHEAQLLSYLRLSGLKVGLLINFHVRSLRDGIRRVVHGYPDISAPSALSAASALKEP